MPDYERPAEENKRRLETASYRDPPPNNYGNDLLERLLSPQQQQQLSGGRKKTGGIMHLANYKGWIVEIRIPKWTDSSKLWINIEDLEAAQYIADAAYYFTGQRPFHFPNANLVYLSLRLSTGEELTTREQCLAYVAKIAKGPLLRGQRKDFKERAQKLFLEMVKRPEVVRFLITVRASPRQAWQPRPEVNPEDTDSLSIEGEKGTAMEVGAPSEEAIVALADDGDGTPMEFDSLSEEAIQALAPITTVNPASVFQFDSTMTSLDMDVDLWTAYIPSFEMDLCENYLTSAGQSLGIWNNRFGEKEKEGLVPDNCKELMASLDKGEEEIWKSIEPLNVKL